MSDTIHLELMQRCIMLAEKGRMTVTPNPAVGAIIVREGEVVAEGWHQHAGGPHAEVAALEAAGDSARGASLYVCLEPCSHWGKTPPCCEAIISSGIRRVVYGMKDPNPLVSGSGLQKLQDAGIEVLGPVLESQCRALNPGFIKRLESGVPYVRCKMAMSLDGRTAMADGESKWISGEESRLDVQFWRARSCAVMTGVDTVIKDDPGLNVRIDSPRQPLRVIVDSRRRTPAGARTLGLEGEVFLATGEQFPGSSARVELRALMSHLAADKLCNEVFVEAGPTLSGALLQAGLVDELIVYIGPKLMGHKARPLFYLPGLEAMADALALETMDVSRLGNDCRVRYRVLN